MGEMPITQCEMKVRDWRLRLYGADVYKQVPVIRGVATAVHIPVHRRGCGRVRRSV
jgi:hypothetical protein